MKLLIKSRPYQGEYDFDIASFTAREWGWIRRLTGYTPLTIEDGLADPELLCVFAAIAMRRAGKLDNTQVADAYERLIDDPAFETIDVDQEGEDGGADPPPSSSSSTATSGDASPTSSVRSETPRNGTGTPASATSASAPPALVT